MEEDSPADLVDQAAEIAEIGQSLWMQLLVVFESLLRPWNAYQLVIICVALLVAQVLGRFCAPELRNWLRTRVGWPKWRLRWALVVHRRLRGVIFVALIWSILIVMREVTWPSRSYIIGIVANLALAWLVVTFATRLIGNSLMRSIVRYGAWSWVTLRILGLTAPAIGVLDAAAYETDDFRISLWLILQGVFILSVFFFIARFISRQTSKRVQANADISPSMQVLVVKFLQVVLYGAAFFIGLNAVGFDLTGLAVLSGAIGVGLGFGLQKVVSNLVSGIIILLDKSIKPGDVITWRLSGGEPHIGVVVNRIHPSTGNPLIVHNLGAGVRAEDLLDFATPHGAYRFAPDEQSRMTSLALKQSI